ncbi:hypothetical protein LO762_17930 [Actinocorallia sp. API 0066]|uniref:hypothetical protein n=1 Tax=Actinocorallia sp. API 0066 TaxID=2896846 RepID=UPI001E4598F4|nr:hypothetical protein [Actinocorallia sp. API 0066]MCD0451063.1 hypothetical protein [Actinocorallia sp. API 0066]
MTGRLARGLGIAGHARVLLVGAPAAFDLGELPGDVLLTSALPDSPDLAEGEAHWQVIVVFVPDAESLARLTPKLLPRLAHGGALWLAWPAAGPLTEADVRAHAAAHALTPGPALTVADAWPALAFTRP